MPDPCSCRPCADGAPKQWLVVVSGVTNKGCGSCGNLNSSSYYLDRQADVGTDCVWAVSFTTVCGKFNKLQLTISGDCTSRTATVVFTNSGGPIIINGPVWTRSGLRNCFDVGDGTFSGGSDDN